ncbi:hypothetical protein E5288_WYG007514 [Bos mutus]|uniref:Uncharacterized protein n=1 Tax=Bos mutus TaxID=72004 RepID=A0A6B0RB71_9CETA|nr:hypothetical protein [Bos mutus]
MRRVRPPYGPAPSFFGRQVSVSLRVPGPSRPRGALLTLLSGREQQVGAADPSAFPGPQRRSQGPSLRLDSQRGSGGLRL